MFLPHFNKATAAPSKQHSRDAAASASLLYDGKTDDADDYTNPSSAAAIDLKRLNNTYSANEVFYANRRDEATDLDQNSEIEDIQQKYGIRTFSRGGGSGGRPAAASIVANTEESRVKYAASASSVQRNSSEFTSGSGVYSSRLSSGGIGGGVGIMPSTATANQAAAASMLPVSGTKCIKVLFKEPYRSIHYLSKKIKKKHGNGSDGGLSTSGAAAAQKNIAIAASKEEEYDLEPPPSIYPRLTSTTTCAEYLSIDCQRCALNQQYIHVEICFVDAPLDNGTAVNAAFTSTPETKGIMLYYGEKKFDPRCYTRIWDIELRSERYMHALRKAARMITESEYDYMGYYCHAFTSCIPVSMRHNCHSCASAVAYILAEIGIGNDTVKHYMREDKDILPDDVCDILERVERGEEGFDTTPDIISFKRGKLNPNMIAKS